MAARGTPIQLLALGDCGHLDGPGYSVTSGLIWQMLQCWPRGTRKLRAQSECLQAFGQFTRPHQRDVS